MKNTHPATCVSFNNFAKTRLQLCYDGDHGMIKMSLLPSFSWADGYMFLKKSIKYFNKMLNMFFFVTNYCTF